MLCYSADLMWDTVTAPSAPSLLLRDLHCAFLGPSACSASLGDDLPPFPNQIFEREIV